MLTSRRGRPWTWKKPATTGARYKGTMDSPADRLLAIVGEHNPRIKEELRFYVGEHPWKVADLLSSAKKGHRGSTAQRGEQSEEADPEGGEGAQTSRTRKKRSRRGTDQNVQRAESVYGLLKVIGL